MAQLATTKRKEPLFGGIEQGIIMGAAGVAGIGLILYMVSSSRSKKKRRGSSGSSSGDTPSMTQGTP